MTLPKIPPVSAADIPEEWPAMVREIVQREGHAVRASAIEPIIEVKSLTTNRWHPMGLPGGGTTFVDYAERNLILNRIINT